MQFQNGTRGTPLQDQTLGPVESCVQLALGRYPAQIRSAEVTAFSSSSPERSHDEQCRIPVSLRDGPSLLIEGSAPTVESATSQAADRAEHRLDRCRNLATAHDTRTGPQVAAPLPASFQSRCTRARTALLLTCGEPGPLEEGMDFLSGRFELDVIREVQLRRFGLLRTPSREGEELRTRLLQQVTALQAQGIAVVAHETCTCATGFPRGRAGFAALEATIGVLRRYGWTEWVVGLWVDGDGSIRCIDPSAEFRFRVSGDPA